MPHAAAPVVEHHHGLIEITVNNQAVRVERPETTALAIKQAAIAQGVQIDVNFQLAAIRPNGERDILDDGDQVRVHKGSAFVATAPDDNS